MTEAEFGDFLKRMSEVAKVVNSFSSETVQRDVFAAILDAMNENSGSRFKEKELSPLQRTEKNVPARLSSKIDGDLDLRPAGKQSFVDFIALKNPSSNQDKFAVVIYYLEQVLEMQSISVDHVRKVFRLTEGWREPADVDTALRVTAVRKVTIDTSDMENLKTTAQGRNFVQHDLPVVSSRSQ